MDGSRLRASLTSFLRGGYFFLFFFFSLFFLSDYDGGGRPLAMGRIRNYNYLLMEGGKGTNLGSSRTMEVIQPGLGKQPPESHEQTRHVCHLFPKISPS